MLALLLFLPLVAVAKPYPTDSGGSLNGDPTADDQPSPAPKGNKAAKFAAPEQSRSIESIEARARAMNARIAVEIFFRLIANLR
ncbi:MAG: hypothetical protein ACM3JJ_04960 [Hyphomicrobiales bacterium]